MLANQVTCIVNENLKCGLDKKLDKKNVISKNLDKKLDTFHQCNRNCNFRQTVFPR